jgi:hypothetical protein
LEELAASFFRSGQCEKCMGPKRNRKRNRCLEELGVSSFRNNPEEESIYLILNEITDLSEQFSASFRDEALPCHARARTSTHTHTQGIEIEYGFIILTAVYEHKYFINDAFVETIL